MIAEKTYNETGTIDPNFWTNVWMAIAGITTAEFLFVIYLAATQQTIPLLLTIACFFSSVLLLTTKSSSSVLLSNFVHLIATGISVLSVSNIFGSKPNDRVIQEALCTLLFLTQLGLGTALSLTNKINSKLVDDNLYTLFNNRFHTTATKLLNQNKQLPNKKNLYDIESNIKDANPTENKKIYKEPSNFENDIEELVIGDIHESAPKIYGYKNQNSKDVSESTSGEKVPVEKNIIKSIPLITSIPYKDVKEGNVVNYKAIINKDTILNGNEEDLDKDFNDKLEENAHVEQMKSLGKETELDVILKQEEMKKSEKTKKEELKSIEKRKELDNKAKQEEAKKLEQQKELNKQIAVEQFKNFEKQRESEIKNNQDSLKNVEKGKELKDYESTKFNLTQKNQDPKQIEQQSYIEELKYKPMQIQFDNKFKEDFSTKSDKNRNEELKSLDLQRSIENKAMEEEAKKIQQRKELNMKSFNEELQYINKHKTNAPSDNMASNLSKSVEQKSNKDQYNSNTKTFYEYE